MDIYYTNKTLYVTLFGDINKIIIEKMQKRVFGILDDYEINNIEVRVNEYESGVFSDFINNYKNKYQGNLKIK